jgi:hypothetical protein
MRIPIAWLGLLALLAGRGAAQSGGGEPKYLSIAAWRPVLGTTSTNPGSSSEPEPGFRLLAPLAVDALGEELASRLAVEPPPITRDTLTDEGDSMHRYAGLPGGIVLGLTAQVPAELAGARLVRDENGVLGLRLDARSGGRFVRAPNLAPEWVRACARFVRGHLDGLFDLGYEGSSRPAPAFAGGEFTALLKRMDEVPHRVAPETRVWKTLILDRATRVELAGDQLAFGADLEVRCYTDAGGTGWARRARVIDASGADFIGPRMAGDLSGELAPLTEIAGWLGFLRWAEHADPQGFGALCE